MINDKSSDQNRFINGILIFIAFAMLAASIYLVYLAWRTGLEQSRAETVTRLMAIRTSPRSTETPGINAWVSWSLLNNPTASNSDENQQLRGLVAPRSGKQFPPEFQKLLNVMQKAIPDSESNVTFKSDEEIGGTSEHPPLEFRKVNYVENRDHLFVLTARKDDLIQGNLEQFSATATSHLIEINETWQQTPNSIELPNLKRIRSARVARFYVLNEDESLISLPLGSGGSKTSDESDQVRSERKSKLYLSEGDEFRKNPLSPSFVSNSFFFNFQFDKPLNNQASFSGLYLDLGGLGLIATVTKPVIYNGKRSVLGADIAFDMDWETFAQNLSPNLISQVAHIQNAASQSWNPWNEFLQSVPDGKLNLRNEIEYLAELESMTTEPSPRKSIYLAKGRDGGEVMALQVDRSTWLLLLVAANEIKLPWTTIGLTSLVFLSLLFRIEQNRRQAVSAQRAARGEMQEKQNLLDTMQVPLMVVDPNTDQVVYCNRAAETIGMKEGDFFGKDIVSTDPCSQEHYLKTQTMGKEHRRAYGVPIQMQSDSANASYAVVRSVAVTAPIESLKADERHRLGILFLIDEQMDLELLLEQRINESQTDEKRRLSGLMNHGIDSLARVLKNQVTQESESSNNGKLNQWLSSYLSDRIQLIAWMLENWGQTPSNAEQRIIEVQTAKTTLLRYNELFQIAASDRQLREQLHWNNGIVSATQKDDQATSSEVILWKLDWSEETCFSVPRDGVFGFFLGEVLVNAVRHGRPGAKINVVITENRIRNEIEFVVSNEVEPSNAAETTIPNLRAKPFGGTAIMAELSRLSGWSEPTVAAQNGNHTVRWTVPAIRKKPDSQGD